MSDADNAPLNLSVSMTVAEFEALANLVDTVYCIDPQVVADARKAYEQVLERYCRRFLDE